ncbi:hypothetical protein BWD12_08685 [Leptospira santarosai serovar Bananal]|uniref:Uncharacterized protein n=1 Tax=Leptospira santarosai TaxID=28183 RepID=A0AB73LYU6_9LEPT|nr:hypothetical protein B2G51_10305 [Leptospira santarosai]OLY62024.1 hypothetical protein BV917_01835 [Leptospira santarosai serovar Guaricura]OLY63324.1 hypothetical protein BWD11_14875 [Leptospira santarosai serovar Grippotyphosa]ONF79331.1 hypothetical protein BWD12_08685 [Leptospira santarosai serovar Bananal]ONF85212.1 hypothetical protein BWD13_14325 [Leptospira santarosai serovar Grippotyphosa]
MLFLKNNGRSFQKDRRPRFFKQFRKKEFSFFSTLVSLDPKNGSETQARSPSAISRTVPDLPKDGGLFLQIR